MNNINFKISKHLDDVLIDEWKSLWLRSRHATFFNSYEWFVVCLKTYNIKDYEILLWYQEGKLVAVMPSVRGRRFGVPVIGSPSRNGHVQSPLLLEQYEKDLVASVFDTLGRQGNVFLTHIDENLARVIVKSNKNIFASAIAKQPSIDLSQNPGDHFSGSSKRGIRKILKKNHDTLDYRLVEVGKNKQSELAKLVEVDQNSTKKLKGGDLFSDDENRTLFKNIFEFCPHFVRIAYLYYKSKPIAYMFNFATKDTLFEFHTGYLLQYAKLSPGKVLLYEILNDVSGGLYKELDLGLNFTGLMPKVIVLYDIYYSKNLLISLTWRTINSVRRLKQVLLHRDFFEDYKFLFKTLK